jgi:hypothetical protein
MKAWQPIASAPFNREIQVSVIEKGEVPALVGRVGGRRTDGTCLNPRAIIYRPDRLAGVACGLISDYSPNRRRASLTSSSANRFTNRRPIDTKEARDVACLKKRTVVPTANPKQLSIACESVDNHGDGRSPRVDLVRRGRAVPVARPCKPKFSPFGISSMC